jgi:hypothetical protein
MHSALGWAEEAAVLAYGVAQALVVLYASHRWLILARWWRHRDARRVSTPVPLDPAALEKLPTVTIQLPVYDERRVIERLIDAAAALEYPAGRLEIQVLDDSTDETSVRAAAAVARHRARGVDIRHLRREGRDGFKAGALAAGLARARGELIAVFDADFVPRPDFLLRVAPRFLDPRVGMVQARWTHLNRDQSALTRAQAVMLDAHFLLEHDVRMRDGLFFNFNGTGGVWRRACIEAVGGWQCDTLTEDLDLSYRAQLGGWRFVFDPAVETPAELPSDAEALMSQQRRWAKGSIQTARKLLPRLLRSSLDRRIKAEAVIHLTANVAYPLLLALGLLLLPVLLGPSRLPPALVWTLQLAVIAFGIVPVALFLALGQVAARRPARRIVPEVVAALVLGAGLSVNNARAVIEGLRTRLGDWERTPKRGDSRSARGAALYPRAAREAGWVEGLLAIYFAGLSVFVTAAGFYRALPFALLLMAGFAWLSGNALGARRATREGKVGAARAATAG